jgi:capsular exopolysaccharide synthesis family protein
MSNIFDALQRSEAESADAGHARLLEATELLRRAESRAASQWEAETTLEDFETIPVGQIRARAEAETRQEPLEERRQWTATATLEVPAELPPAPPANLPGGFGKFRTLMVSPAMSSRFVCFNEVNSAAAEAFRLLGVRLRHLRRERTLNKVLITSTIPQEGKSTVAANLACTLSTRQKVLLLEGDLRRPSLSHVFGLERRPGLSEWLRGEAGAAECIYQLDSPEFWLLPAGNAAGKPLELLQSGRLATLIDQLAGWFDWVVIDSPPVLPLADTSVWARLADGILLVARQGTTEKKQLKRGLEALEPRKMIGALLNCSHTNTGSGYYYSTPAAETPEAE